jgi:hypothetical protein
VAKKTVFFLFFFLFGPEIFPQNQPKKAPEEKDLREEILEKTYISLTGKKHTKYTVDIVYDNYKFFTVKTEVRIR